MRRAALPALLLALALPAAPAGAATLGAGATVAISGTPDLLGLLATPVGAATATGQAVDAAGDRVVFTSASDGLLASDDDDVTNVYVKDGSDGSGALQLASVGADGQPSHVNCGQAVISADGTHVAFACDGPLDPADTNGFSDVYVRDLVHRTTTLVSRASGLGAVGDGDSKDPSISSDGRFVAFTSRATNLVPGTTVGGGVDRIMRRELGNGDAVLLLSRLSGAAGTPPRPNALDAEHPSISANGAAVAFDTADALNGGDSNSASDAYVRVNIGAANEATVAASVISITAPGFGAVGNGSSTHPVLSGDGAKVAFASSATNLLGPGGPDLDATADVYVHDLNLSTTTLVSTSSGGVKANGESIPTGIDATGDVIGLRSVATNLDAADFAPGPDDYVKRVAENQLVLVSRASGAAGLPAQDAAGVAISGNGKTAVMSVGHGIADDGDASMPAVVRRDVAGAATLTVSRPPGAAPFADDGGAASGGSVSADGRYVAFASTAPLLGALDGSGSLFVRDTLTGAVTQVNRADGPHGAILPAHDPQISADGRRVAFVVDTSPSQVEVRDLASARTYVASRADGPDDLGTELGNDESFAPSISADGSRVAFVSRASNLVVDDTSHDADVYVRDLGAGDTSLVDRNSGATGAKAADGGADPAISGDGHWVAFDTDSSLDSRDGDGLFDVYERNVETDQTALVSTGSAGKGLGDSSAPSISTDGNRLSFLSDATNFGVPGPPAMRLYVRDVAARTLTLAGRADGTSGAALADAIGAQQLSADGQHVVFEAASSAGIAPDVPADGAVRVFERDLGSGATRLVSRATGAGGQPARPAQLGGVTATGGCVAFATASRMLPQASADFTQVFLRAITPGCGPPPAPPAPPVKPPPAPGGGGPVVTPPAPVVLSALSLKPSRLFVGGRGSGTRIAFRLSGAASVTLTFERLLPGHLKGRSCATTVHTGRRCTVVRSAGHLTLHARAGASTVAFTGKLGGHALAIGSYRLTATPLHGKAVSVRFTVVKAPKPARKPTNGKAGR